MVDAIDDMQNFGTRMENMVMYHSNICQELKWEMWLNVHINTKRNMIKPACA